MYVIKLALKNIINRKKTYALISLEIIIGIIALGVFSNLLLSIRSTFENIDNDIKYHMYYVDDSAYADSNFSSTTMQSESNTEVKKVNDYSNYCMIKEKYDVNVVMYATTNRILKSDSQARNKEINLFFVTPEFFKLIFKDQPTFEENTIYAGEEALTAMRNKQIDSALYDGMEQFQNYDEQKDIVTLMSGENYAVHEYSNKDSDTFDVFTGVLVETYRIANSIFLPFTLTDQTYFNQLGLSKNTLGIYFDGVEEPQVMLEILNDLNESLGMDRKADCSYLNPLIIYNVNVDQYEEMGQVFVIISSFCIVIIITGLIAFNMMEFNKRKRSIGIKKSIGATNSQLLLESLAESCIVTLASGVVGGIIAVIILAMDPFDSSFFVITINYPLIIGFIVLSFLIGFISNIGIAMRIKNLNPVYIMKEL
ncbi:MAG TPA: hypothetical protein DCE48_17110 [Lachnospiraceae bacterium]|uniref:ABC transporter permease n=1 Tax=Anaerosporobacter sp. TaxID=1872529 RepID=UPI000EE38F08|nr:ABC transporter permease [Anaerosporobacter sp.]HAB62384.1 hypothetical protein [Lachnospiraceae bacterium]